ncbi:MAG: DUF1292 domain-containing protein [Clostridia bacterium]|nr:DUF1292 domain-containing protein [Clostridia bacterium]
MDKKKIQKIEEVSKKVEEEENELDLVDVLLDVDNKDPIVLIDGSGKRISFEQIAVIPYNDKIYCVLKPIDKIDNVQDDEAIVFYVDEKDGEKVLMVETDEKVAISVFDEYYNLLDKEESKNKKGSKK